MRLRRPGSCCNGQSVIGRHHVHSDVHTQPTWSVVICVAGTRGQGHRTAGHVTDIICFPARRIICYSVCFLLLSEPDRRRKNCRFAVFPINKVRKHRGVMAKRYPQPLDDEDKFRNYTRMTKNTFEDLLLRVGSQIRRADTNLKLSISPRERISSDTTLSRCRI